MSDQITAESLLAFIQQRGGNVSFAELHRIKGAEGPLEYGIEGDRSSNIVLWVNLSKELIDALDALRGSGQIHYWPTSLLTYLIDGRSLSLPLAKRVRHYKEPRWLPCVVKLGAPPLKFRKDILNA